MSDVEKLGKTISLRPTPEGYARLLLVLIQNTTSESDRRAAQQTIEQVFRTAAEHGIITGVDLERDATA